MNRTEDAFFEARNKSHLLLGVNIKTTTRRRALALIS